MSTQITGDAVMTCQGCGASVYREHIDRGLAGRWAGLLLCSHCLSERKKSAGGHHEGAPLAGAEEGHDLVPHPDKTSVGLSAIVMSDPEAAGYRRPLNRLGTGASRIRIWHCKLSDGPLSVLNQQINEWLEVHPDVEVKFATTTIGEWEGRRSEAQFIITLYY